MTPSFARLFVLPSLKRFQERYKDVELILTLGDGTVDLIQDGMDCVIRAGIPHDSATLVARRIAGFEWITCGSPEYLEKNGEPQSLEDLQNHHAVGYLSSSTGRAMDWNFVVADEEYAIHVPERFTVNDTDAYVFSGLEGLGLIRAASYMVAPHLRSGRLRRVLSEFKAPTVPLSLMYPQNRHLSPTVRIFADWIVKVMQEVEPQWNSQS